MTAPADIWGSVLSLWGGQNTGDGTQSLAVAASKIGQVFLFESDLDTDTITHVGHYIASEGGAGPGATGMKAGLQGVDTAGLPDGTYLGGGSPASVVFASGTAATFEWQTLDNTIVLTRGTMYSQVLEHNEVDIVNFMTAGTTIGTYQGRAGMPYGLTHSGASWAKNTNAPYKLALKSASRVYFFPLVNSFNAATFGGTVSLGYLFKVPTTRIGTGGTYKVKGFRYRGRNSSSATANTWKVLLWASTSYTGSGTFTPTSLLAKTPALDPDHMNNNLTDATIEAYWSTASLPSMTAETWYMVEVCGQDATNLSMVRAQVQSVGDWEAFHYGQNTAYGTRTITYANVETDLTNAFTITPTIRPVGEIILADVTYPTAGGGGGQRVIGG